MTPGALARIHEAAFTHGRPWSAVEFGQLLDQPTVRLLGAAEGFALVQIVPPEAELLTIAVAPAAQRQGLGRALLSRAMEAAAAEGATRLFLEVDIRNAAAIALYEAAGFARTGLRRAYYRHPDATRSDALLMEIALPARQTGTGAES